MLEDLSVRELRKAADLLGNDWYLLGIKLKIPIHRLEDLCTPIQGGPERHPIRDHEGSAQRQKKLQWFQSTQLPHVKQKTGRFAEWFHGIIHRRKAELLLENKPKGSFLIRVSESRLGYSLSFNAEDRCRHYVIDQTLSKKYVVTGESHGHQSLSDLVLYYQQNTLPNSTLLLGESCGQQNGECDFENLLTPLDQTDSND